jgi:membrane-associated phospholipid phosphatase
MNIISVVRSFTNLADEAVLLPLSAAIGTTLFFQWKRGSVAWIIGMLVTLSTIVIAKLVCYAIVGHWPFNINLRSPSGHVAAGAAVYGMLVALVIGRGDTSILAAFICSVFIATFFAATRLYLEVHTRSEVVIGALIGVLGAVTIAKLAGSKQHLNPVPLIIVSTLIIALTHGSVLRSEHVIAGVSHKIKVSLKQKFE